MISSLPIETREVPCLKINENSEITFAHYWQPEKEEQWAYEVEWIAIKDVNHAILLVSKEGLYCRPLDTEGAGDWKGSALRKWLNGEWIQNTFEYGDENMVVPVPADTPLEVPSLLPYRTPGEGFREKGEDEDYVFLLSCEEIKELLHEDRICLEPFWMADRSSIQDPHFVKWWARPENGTVNNCVDEAGREMYCDVGSENVFVRPAVWVDNYYIRREHEDAVREWEKLVREAKENRFDYGAFQHAAVSAYGILYLYSRWTDHVISYPKLVMELVVLIARFSDIGFEEETVEHRLALIAAERLCDESVHWTTIYRRNPGPGQAGSLKNGFVMYDLAGQTIVVDADTFDMMHPFDVRRLVREGYYIL